MHDFKELSFIDEKIYEDNINGLRVFYIPKEGFAKSYAIMTADYGSKDVEFSMDGGKTFRRYPEGIAHFLEHKLFEMPGGENIFNRFTEQGASVNAFTNNRQTSYYFSCTENFYENLELLLRMVTTPHLTEENVEKEKGIIAEEIAMYEDNPGFRGYLEAMKALYHKHPVREDIAGTKESIYSLTAQDLIDCYNAFYNPKNMILVIVGDLDADRLDTLIAQNVKPREDISIVKKTYDEPFSSLKKEAVCEMNLQVPNYILAYKMGRTETDLLKESLTGAMLSRLVFGRSSEFFEKNLKEGHLNDSFSSEFNLEADHGEFFLGGESKEPEKMEKILKDFVEEVKKDGDFFERKASEIELIKKSMTGNFMNVFNGIDSIGTFVTGFILREKSLYEYVQVLRGISPKDLKDKFFEIFNDENNAFIIIR